jgi:hypothetical protein
MPIKSLTLNGFLGGINLDADLSDLQSEDERGGKNHLVQCKNFNCNQPGKIRSKNPGVATGSGDLSSAGSPSATDDFLIHGTTYYRKQGVYKLGEDVEWSGKNNVRKPLSIGFGTQSSGSNIKDNSVGMNAYGSESASDIDYVFLGAMATENNTGAGMIATGNLNKTNINVIPATSDTPAHEFVKWDYDGDNDHRFEGGQFNSLNRMGYFNATPDATVAMWEEGGSDPTSGDSNYGYVAHDATSGTLVEQAGFGTVTTDADISDADYIRFGKNSSASATTKQNDLGVCFRVGKTKITNANSTKHLGLYGQELDITDKDIMIEMQINADSNTGTGGSDYGAGNFWTNFELLNITADCHDGDHILHYSDDDYDSYTKTWEISKSKLTTHGVNVSTGSTNGTAGGSRFKIPYGSAVHTGPNFSAANVKNVYVVLVSNGDQDAPGHTDPETIWVARLFELSFLTSDTVGWSNTNTSFSQSRIYTSSSTGNKVESLPQPYTNSLTLTTETSMKLDFYQPNTANYEGRIYYQEADKNGNGIGAMFLLAEISRNKGVKNILSDFYEKWNTFSISGCTVTRGDTNTVTAISDTSSIEVGMRVYSDPASPLTSFTEANNIYVAGITSSTAITLSTTLSGSAANGKILYFNGITKLAISDPPISETYQLSAGYAQETETINALWEHSAVVGRQIYIGNVIKTGDDLFMESSVGTPSTEEYPMLDTIEYSGNATKTLTITINDASADQYKYQLTGGSLSSAQSIPSTGAWVDVDQSTAANANNIKIKFPTTHTYSDNDAWTYELKKETDLVLKSAIGNRYGFSNLDYIDLELPGTGITAMFSAGDRLFLFSLSQLNIVNVAQDYEFIEATMAGHGVANAKQVVEVGEGLAFVNSTGVYYFDGNNMNNISDDLMMTYDWSAAQAISYIPSEKLICVYIGASNDLYAYSLNTKSWVSRSTSSGSTPSTRVKFYNNEATYLYDATLYKLVVEDFTATGAVLETGKISCGNMSMIKKFIKMYVTTVNGAELEVAWSLDGGSYSSATDLTDNGTDEVAINGTGKTIQLKISSDTTVVAGTEISEIRLIYRDLRIK